MSRTVLATSAGLIGAALLAPLPAAAQSLPEPALEAQPVDADQWQRQIARDIPGYVSFVEHARFEPALDADGQPIDSVFIADCGATRLIVAAHYAGEPES